MVTESPRTKGAEIALCVNVSGPAYPDIWPNIILDVPVKIFIEVISL